MSRMLLLGSDIKTDLMVMPEVCDSCICQIFLPKDAMLAINAEEASGGVAELLCVDCGLYRYGPNLAARVRESLREDDALSTEDTLQAVKHIFDSLADNKDGLDAA